MTPFEHLSARWPGIEEKVLDRLVADESLFDGKAHTLREGISSKEEARAILLLASKTARDCGLKIIFSRDEEDLMARKFAVGSH
jgi:hypothetical protein